MINLYEFGTAYDFAYNENATEPAQIWSDLSGGAKSLTLQTDDAIFVAQIKYNHSCAWAGVVVYDDAGTQMQGWTYLSKFPVNNLIARELRGYALFWDANNNALRFGAIPDDWYNADLSRDDWAQIIANKELPNG